VRSRHQPHRSDLDRWSAFELPAVAEARRRRELDEAALSRSLASSASPRRPRQHIEAVRRGVCLGRQLALAIWSLLTR